MGRTNLQEVPQNEHLQRPLGRNKPIKKKGKRYESDKTKCDGQKYIGIIINYALSFTSFQSLTKQEKVFLEWFIGFGTKVRKGKKLCPSHAYQAFDLGSAGKTFLAVLRSIGPLYSALEKMDNEYVAKYGRAANSPVWGLFGRREDLFKKVKHDELQKTLKKIAQEGLPEEREENSEQDELTINSIEDQVADLSLEENSFQDINAEHAFADSNLMDKSASQANNTEHNIFDHENEEDLVGVVDEALQKRKPVQATHKKINKPREFELRTKEEEKNYNPIGFGTKAPQPIITKKKEEVFGEFTPDDFEMDPEEVCHNEEGVFGYDNTNNNNEVQQLFPIDGFDDGVCLGFSLLDVPIESSYIQGEAHPSQGLREVNDLNYQPF